MVIDVKWTQNMEEVWLDTEEWEPALNGALEAMEPEAKRDLAARLLASANKAEGYEAK